MKKIILTSVAAVAVAGAANAKTLVLEGSDATGFHHDSNYTAQLFSYMKEGSSLPVLVFGTVGLSGAPGDTVYTTDLSGLNNASYSALYIQSPGGCCDDNRTGALAWQAQITAFYNGGGSLAIQDYQGGDWGTILSFVAPSTVIGGYGGGAGGSSCFDTEVFTANALAKGFTQPGVLGCWGHQSYDMKYFGPLGFTNLVESNNGLGAGWSSFLALGGTLGTVPEPDTWAMLILGMGMAGAAMRRRNRAARVSFA